jgi:hypothetical protein
MSFIADLEVADEDDDDEEEEEAVVEDGEFGWPTFSSQVTGCRLKMGQSGMQI